MIKEESTDIRTRTGIESATPMGLTRLANPNEPDGQAFVLIPLLPL
jgi:hypothetical protein